MACMPHRRHAGGMQNTPLYSQDGTVYLEQQDTGALTLFNTADGAIIYSTYVYSTNGPFYTIQQTVWSRGYCRHAVRCGLLAFPAATTHGTLHVLLASSTVTAEDKLPHP